MKGKANSALAGCKPRMWGGDILLKSESFSGLGGKDERCEERDRKLGGRIEEKNHSSYRDNKLGYYEISLRKKTKKTIGISNAKKRE